MSEAIVVAIITGGMSLVGVIVTSLVTARKSENAIKIAQAVTDTKIQELTREVREHNNFAKRMPVVDRIKEVPMETIKKNLASLIKVKTIVTMVVIAVFAVLALRGDIGPDNAMVIISMVVSFYFGTQHEKNQTENPTA